MNGFHCTKKISKAKQKGNSLPEIIGEAVSRILGQDNSIQLSNSGRIVDTRNRIIHGYDTVSDEVIWGIIQNHLPTLKQEVLQLLGE